MKRLNGSLLFLVAATVILLAFEHSAYGQDCNENGIDDECDLDCGYYAGACHVPGCGVSADCDANGVLDECELAGNDCNANYVLDECDIVGAGGAVAFSGGMEIPQDIVPSQGDYPAGFFVPDTLRSLIWHVSPLGGTITRFATMQDMPVGAVFVPDEFGCEGGTLLATDRGPPDEPDVVVVRLDGTVGTFVELPNSRYAFGVSYIPIAVGGPAAGKVLVTGGDEDARNGRVYLVDGDCQITEIAEAHVADTWFWTPAIAPADFGERAHHVFLGDCFSNRIFSLDLQTKAFSVFVEIPFVPSYVGVRQIAFSPIGWASPLDPRLDDASVLLVSMASHMVAQDDQGAVMVWDQHGRLAGVLNRGGNGIPLEPRGLTFVGSDLLISDVAPDHGFLHRASVDDFGVRDCNCNHVPDACDVGDGTSLDGNENGVPDECEAWTGDVNGDCRVTLEDYAVWLSCFSGPSLTEPPDGCDYDVSRASDSDYDGDVDLVDFAELERAYTADPN